MKLFAGIAAACVVLMSGTAPQKPDVMFQPGTKLTYAGISDPDGKLQYKYAATLTVTEAENSGGRGTATALMVYTAENRKGETEPYDAILMRFAYDSLNYYVHAVNYSTSRVSKESRANLEANGDSLWYPLNMKVGDTLRDSWFKSVSSGNDVFTMSDTKFRKRKVVAADTLQFSFGAVPVYRIEMTRVDDVRFKSPATGEQTTRNETKITEWFSPRLGVVRAVYEYDRYVQRMELERYAVK